MTGLTTYLGLTTATYGELVGTWDVAWNANMNALEARLATPYNGNPNGNVAGYWEGQQVFDYTNNIPYVCTATGVAAVAVWTKLNVLIGFSSINTLAALTAPAVGDLFAMWDLSASGNVSISATDWLKVIAGLTALSASDTDLSNDILPIYDVSASAIRRGTPQSFTGIDPIAYSVRALSASTVFALGSAIAFTHGLGASAKGAQAWYVCTATEGGYSVGDRLQATAWYDAGPRGVQVIIDNATEVKAAIGTSAIANIISKDGTTSFVLTATNWALSIEAWA